MPTAPISLHRKSTSLPPKLCQSLPETYRYFSESHSINSLHNEQQPLPGKLMLRVRFPQNVTKLAAVFQFDWDFTVQKAFQVVKQKSDTSADGTSSAETGLFIDWDASEYAGTWMKMDNFLREYNLQYDTPLLFRSKFRTLQVTDLDGGSRKKLNINETAPVSVLIALVGKRFGIEDVSEFSLQVQRKNELVWLKLDQSLPEQGVREHQSLVFRKKFFVTDMLVTANQPALLHLLLLESRFAIISSLYACTFEQAVEFAALQMQISYGNYDPLSHVYGFLNVNEFLPLRFRETPFIEEDVYREHRKLKDLDELESKSRYVRKCFKLPTYGATFKPVVETFSDQEHDHEQEKEILLGVNCDALLCMSRRSKSIVSRNLLLEIVGVQLKTRFLTLNFKGRKRVFEFDTDANAELLNDLIVGYLEFRKSKRQEKFARTQAKGGLCSALPPQMAPLLLAGSQQRLKALHLISSLSSNRISQVAAQHS